MEPLTPYEQQLSAGDGLFMLYSTSEMVVQSICWGESEYTVTRLWINLSHNRHISPPVPVCVTLSVVSCHLDLLSVWPSSSLISALGKAKAEHGSYSS
jgi:hypothetical protein